MALEPAPGDLSLTRDSVCLWRVRLCVRGESTLRVLYGVYLYFERRVIINRIFNPTEYKHTATLYSVCTLYSTVRGYCSVL